ncbi:MAG: phosphatase PAP2 family protein [Halobacteriales archaeon]|nr:phosphatase PAP2 family protein [Halobacteriales archaeon]
MSHGIGVVAALRDAPDFVIVAFVALTQLGDLWWFLTALTLAYAFAGTHPRLRGERVRERAAFVIAVALGALAVTYLLKLTVAHPRPPGAETARELAWLPASLEPVWRFLATSDSSSLPSGHATGSAAIYGAVALVSRWGSRRLRYGGVIALVALVAFSRVVIGVHYVGDVLAGLAVGSGYLAVVWLATRGRRVKRAFSLAVAVALVGMFTTLTPETAAILAAALSGRITWTVVGGRLPTFTSRAEGAATAAVALVGATLAVGVALASDGGVVASFVAAAGGIAVLLISPLVTERLLGQPSLAGA